MLELGIDLPVGTLAITRLPVLLDDPEHGLAPAIVSVLLRLHQRYAQLSREIAELETQIMQQTNEEENGQRLHTIPGIDPITASSLLAMAGDARAFKCGRDFAASSGLVAAPTLNWGASDTAGHLQAGQ